MAEEVGTVRRAPLLPGLDPMLAAHVAASLTRYAQWLRDLDRAEPEGYRDLLDATVRVARSGQLRRSAGALGDDARMRTGGLITIGEAALLAGCSARTLRRRVAAGDLPVRRLGRLVRVDPLDLLGYLEAA